MQTCVTVWPTTFTPKETLKKMKKNKNLSITFDSAEELLALGESKQALLFWLEIAVVQPLFNLI